VAKANSRRENSGGNEALCEWKKNKCVDVCDVKKKKECQKPTFQGKAGLYIQLG